MQRSFVSPDLMRNIDQEAVRNPRRAAEQLFHPDTSAQSYSECGLKELMRRRVLSLRMKDGEQPRGYSQAVCSQPFFFYG